MSGTAIYIPLAPYWIWIWDNKTNEAQEFQRQKSSLFYVRITIR